MKKPDAADFLQEVLDDLDTLPDGLAEELLDLVKSAPTHRRDRIRELLSEVASG